MHKRKLERDLGDFYRTDLSFPKARLPGVSDRTRLLAAIHQKIGGRALLNDGFHVREY